MLKAYRFEWYEADWNQDPELILKNIFATTEAHLRETLIGRTITAIDPATGEWWNKTLQEDDFEVLTNDQDIIDAILYGGTHSELWPEEGGFLLIYGDDFLHNFLSHHFNEVEEGLEVIDEVTI